MYAFMHQTQNLTQEFVNFKSALHWILSLSVPEQEQWVYCEADTQTLLSLKEFSSLHLMGKVPQGRPKKDIARLNPRMEKQYFVSIHMGNVSFLGHSKNVSLGGLRLSKKIPSLDLKDLCTIKILVPGMLPVQVSAKLLNPQDLTDSRFQFVDLTETQSTLLEQLCNLDIPAANAA